MNRLLGIALLSLAMGLGTSAFAQSDTGTTNQDTSVKQDMKTAGRATKNATKKTAHKTGHLAKRGARGTKRTTKRVVHKGARKTSQGAGKVEEKTEPQP